MLGKKKKKQTKEDLSMYSLSLCLEWQHIVIAFEKWFLYTYGCSCRRIMVSWAIFLLQSNIKLQEVSKETQGFLKRIN